MGPSDVVGLAAAVTLVSLPAVPVVERLLGARFDRCLTRRVELTVPFNG